jgi:hypothetical protein
MDKIILADNLAKSLSPKCSIRANNDFEAVHSWLSEYQANANTYASYKKEARKFLLWCKEEQQIAIANLSKAFLAQYELLQLLFKIVHSYKR